MKYDKIILITDADGTLLTDDKRILEIDKVALTEFIQNGGLFTIATGRGVSLARVVTHELQEADLLTMPAVIFNGAAVYDYKKEKFLWKCGLCEKGRAYVETLMERFPGIGVEILINDDIYVTGTNKYEEAHLEMGVMNPIRCDYKEVPDEGWIKVLMIDSPDVIDEVVDFTELNPCEYVHVVRSWETYFEVLPQGVNKWTGVEKLLDIMKLEGYRIVTAGDYMNDLEMIRHADLGVATANAEDIVKAVADIIVCDNNSGIIRDILLKVSV